MREDGVAPPSKKNVTVQKAVSPMVSMLERVTEEAQRSKILSINHQFILQMFETLVEKA